MNLKTTLINNVILPAAERIFVGREITTMTRLYRDVKDRLYQEYNSRGKYEGDDLILLRNQYAQFLEEVHVEMGELLEAKIKESLPFINTRIKIKEVNKQHPVEVSSVQVIMDMGDAQFEYEGKTYFYSDFKWRIELYFEDTLYIESWVYQERPMLYSRSRGSGMDRPDESEYHPHTGDSGGYCLGGSRQDFVNEKVLSGTKFDEAWATIQFSLNVYNPADCYRRLPSRMKKCRRCGVEAMQDTGVIERCSCGCGWYCVNCQPACTKCGARSCSVYHRSLTSDAGVMLIDKEVCYNCYFDEYETVKHLIHDARKRCKKCRKMTSSYRVIKDITNFIIYEGYVCDACYPALMLSLAGAIMRDRSYDREYQIPVPTVDVPVTEIEFRNDTIEGIANNIRPDNTVTPQAVLDSFWDDDEEVPFNLADDDEEFEEYVEEEEEAEAYEHQYEDEEDLYEDLDGDEEG